MLARASRGLLALFVLIAMLLAAIFCAFPWSMTSAAAAPRRPAATSRWDPVRQVFGRQGETDGAYFRIDLPRTDLRVTIAGDRLTPRFELTSYVGFMPATGGRVMATGEVVLREEEVPMAMAEAYRQGWRVTALHNHLLGESPRIVTMHVMGEGAPEPLARGLHAVFAATKTPLGPERQGRNVRPADWSTIDAILGKHADTGGATAGYVFPRRERLTVHGTAVRSTTTLETASEVVFQQLGRGRMACTGNLYVLPREVDRVVRTLGSRGFRITAIHNHTLDETPRMFWIHWYATSGDGATLARGVAAALGETNSAKKSSGRG